MKDEKYAVEKIVQEFYGQSMTEDEGFIAPDFFAMAREICNLRVERDEWKNRAEKAERRVFEERTNRAFAVRAIEAERDELQLQVGDWKDVAEQFRDALVERGKVLGFFASVIKSGEPWTPQCDEMLRATFVHKDIVPAAQPSTDTWEDTRARCS